MYILLYKGDLCQIIFDSLVKIVYNIIETFLLADNVDGKDFTFMKKAFRLVLTYFLFLILGTAVGMFFYYVYLHLQTSVAGQQSAFFKKEDLLRVLFYVLGCLLLFVCSAMVYVRISNKGGIAHFIFFIILSAVTWAVFIPLLGHFESKVLYNTKDSSKVLSEGYFRPSGDKIYYFTNEYNKNPYVDTTTIVIDTTAEGTVEIEKIKPTRDFILFRDSAPYSDILLKKAFGESDKQAIISFSLIMEHAEIAFSKGWTFWLGFLSLGLLFASLYGAADLFRWRLLNSGFLMLMTFGIFAANTLYYHPVVTSFRRQYINNKGFFIFLGKYMDDPLLVLANVTLSLVFIIIGIVRFATRKKRSL